MVLDQRKDNPVDLLHNLQCSGQTTPTNDVEQRLSITPQSEVSSSSQSKVGKSVGLAEGGSRDAGTAVPLDSPPPIMLVIRELMSWSEN